MVALPTSGTCRDQPERAPDRADALNRISQTSGLEAAPILSGQIFVPDGINRPARSGAADASRPQRSRTQRIPGLAARPESRAQHDLRAQPDWPNAKEQPPVYG